MSNKIMIVAGEASGDLHGSGVVRGIRAQRPDVEIIGIGGDQMRSQGVKLLYHINEMSVLGFIDVIKQFLFFKKVYRELVEFMEVEKPELIVLIDYPGLNLKLASAAKQRGIKVFYYIAPQVWAWGSNRIPKMAKVIDKLSVILPFEQDLFTKAGLDTTFVGHPLLESIVNKLSRDEFFRKFSLDPHKKVIGLLPGSRNLEVKRLLPTMLKSFQKLKEKHENVQAVIGQTGTVDEKFYNECTADFSEVKIVKNSTYEIMKHADLLLVASGTATLESALFETPMIIVYKVDALSYFIGKRLVKIDNIGLVNVIAGKRIVPEFIQNQFQWNNVLPEMEKLIFDHDSKMEMKKNLNMIRHKLGQPGASLRTARLIVEMLNSVPDA